VFVAGLGVVATSWSSSAAAHRRWINDNPALTTVRWLERHGLLQGVGEYWSANLLTAMSGNAIIVRSVVPYERKVVAYIWVEDRRPYGQPPQFAIWQEPNQTGVTEALVRATYRVCSRENIAGYRIALLSRGANSMRC
jgi:hypothetical protein